MASLVFKLQEPGKDPRDVVLRKGLRIGRHPENDCVLQDGKASAWHAEIVEEAGGLSIRDVGSSNGTQVVDGPELGKDESHPLKVGMSLTIGRCTVEVAEAQAAQTRMMPAAKLDDPAAEVAKESAPAPKASAPSSESKTTGRPIPKQKPEGATTKARPAQPVGEEEVAPGDDEKTSKTAIPAIDEPAADPKADAVIGGPSPTDETRLSSPAMPDPNANKTRVMSVADIMADASPEVAPPPAEEKAPPAAEEKAPPAAGKEEAKTDDDAAAKRAAARAAAVKKAAAKKKAGAAKAAPTEEGGDKAEAPAAKGEKAPAADDAEAKKAAAKKAAIKKAAAKKAAAKKEAEADAEPPAPEAPYQATIAMPAASLKGRPEDLAAIKPRFIVDDRGMRKVLKVTANEFEIGRRPEEASETYGVIENPSISTRHARVRFMEGRFFIEDCGSKNGTKLEGDPLPLMSFKELRPNSQLTFGVVDALYVSDLQPDGAPVSDALYSSAADALERRGILDKSTRQAAAKRGLKEGQHLGEVLILDGKISIEQWVQAIAGGEIAQNVKSAGAVSGSRKLLIILAIIVVFAVLAYMTLF